MALNANIRPYWDDFSQNKHFYRIMFKPGYAVQARELTQLQTQLQNQITNFGKHVFKEGSSVLGGEKFFENDLVSIKLDQQHNAVNIDVNLFINKTITGQSSGTVAVVKAVAPFTDISNPDTILVKIISGTTFTAGEVIIDGTNAATVKATSPFANGIMYGIGEGIFFISGNFVHTTAQSIIVDKYDNTASYNIGFLVNETIITSDDDSSLLDPSLGTPNYSAPGADRYNIEIVLSKKGLGESIDNFIEIARVEAGQLIYNSPTTLYGELEKEFARRTYDESGDYTVKSFPVHIEEHLGTARIEPVIVAGAITSYNIISGGYGYTSTPTITITGNGTNASANATIDTNPASGTYQQIINVTPVTTGSGYTEAYVKASGDANKFSVKVDPGKAYVKGFEFETIHPTYIAVDRARTYDQATSLDTPIVYGNYVYVTSLNKSFDTTSFASVELHNLARASATYGGASKLGTAKVRFVKYVSGTVGGGTEIYKLYLFDIAMDAGKYFKDVESILSAATTGANIDLLSKVGGVAGGDVFLSGSDSVGLVSSLPNSYIKTVKDGSGQSQSDYTFTRVFGSVSFTAGVASITTNDGGERFYGGSGALSDTIKDTYYQVVVTAQGTSAFTVGTVLRFNAAATRSITLATPVNGVAHSATFNANVATNFTASIIATCNANTQAEKLKALQPYQVAIISSPGTTVGAKNSLLKSDIYSIKAIYNTGTTNPTGQVTIDSTTGIVTSWGSVGTHIDVTNSYTLDNGQRDDYYDHGNIVLGANGAVPGATDYLVVIYNYFTHTGNGFFTRDSYSIPYQDIPVFVSPSTGKEYKLRDSIDFRPRRADGGTTLTNGQLPDPDFSFNCDYQYYLPRVDKIIATADKQLVVKQGIPNLIPKAPTDESNGMTLFVLTVPPYTGNLEDVGIKYIENKRYTMRDIGKIEKRVETLEYYTQLSMLEKQAKDESITDSSNFEKFKNGFLVDSFAGHSVGDVQNIDYRCAIDISKRELRSLFDINNLGFNWSSGVNTQKHGDLVTLNYTEAEFVNQPYATKAININPYNVIAYFGTIVLEPAEDQWVETVQLPPNNVVITDDNRRSPQDYMQAVPAWRWNGWGWNGNPFNTWGGWGWNNTWGNWNWGWGNWNWGWWNGWNNGWGSWGSTMQNIPAGQATGDTIVNQGRGLIYRENINYVTDVQETRQSLGNNVVDVQFLPYIRAKTIWGVAQGVKPGARLYPFMEETLVADKCRLLTRITVQDLTAKFDDGAIDYETVQFRSTSVGGVQTGTARVALQTPSLPTDATKKLVSIFDLEGTVSVGQYIRSVDGTKSGLITNVETFALNTALYPDVFGMMAFEFQIPGAQFKTGERTFRLIDNIDNDTKAANSSAEAKYFALGVQQTKQETVLTTRTLSTRRVITRTWYDPLAQSFLVDEQTYPQGLHLSSADAFFRTKSSTVPVTMELRKMVNGYPESTQTIPFGVVTLYPDDVNVSETAAVATNFKFQYPIYLSPGEYSIVLLSNCNEYEAWVAEMGKTMIGTNTKVSQQPYTGVLFKSQNASTWTAVQEEDLKFKLHRANFNSTGSVNVELKDYDYAYSDVTTSIGSNTLTAVQAIGSFQRGFIVVGTGIPDGSTVTGINATAGTVTISNNATAAGTTTVKIYPPIEFSSFNINSSNIEPTGTSITWKIKALNKSTGLMDSTYSPVNMKTDIDFSSVKKIVPKSLNSGTGSIILEGTLNSSSGHVSPVVDIMKLSTVLTKNLINNDSTGETNPKGGNALSKYITKKINLADGFDASNLVVTFDAYKPVGTSFKVYYKVLPVEKTTPFDDESWVEMTPYIAVANSVNANDYKEHKFYPPGAFGAYGVPINNPISPRFNAFAVKIVMLSSVESQTPKIRDFRTIALDS